MSSEYFRCDEHVIPGHHIRGSIRALGSKQDAVVRISVKQYTPLDNTSPQEGDVSFIGAHANGMPKETYEPLWDAFYNYSKRTGAFRIRSIWIADIYFQGQSGVLNEQLLGNDPNWFDHARDLLQMVNHFRMPPPLVGIGHSMGGNAIVNLALLHPRLFTTLVLAEPTMKRLPAEKKRSSLSAAYGATFRKNLWPSRAEASATLRKNRLFKTWDPKVVNLFVKYAVRDLPTPLHPEKGPGAAATLTTPPHQEAVGIARPAYPPGRQALDTFVPTRRYHLDLATGSPRHPDVAFYRPESQITFTQLPHLLPSVLYIFAANAPEGASMRDETLKATGTGVSGSGGPTEGRVASAVVEEAGHFVPFEKPEEVATLGGDWVYKELARWRAEEEEEIKEWRSQDALTKASVDDEYKYWLTEQFARKPKPKTDVAKGSKL